MMKFCHFEGRKKLLKKLVQQSTGFEPQTTK